MKITIEGDAKEIAALLETERLDSKLADVKKEIIGEKVIIPIDLDVSPIENAQKMADKFNATLLGVQELIRQTQSTTCY